MALLELARSRRDQLRRSTIARSVLQSSTALAGRIDPQYVILQNNSYILANAVFGPGGNINITMNLLLPDSTSVISASSQFGQQGTDLNPITRFSCQPKIVPLSQKPLIETALVSQRCAAIADGRTAASRLRPVKFLPAEPRGMALKPIGISHR